MNYVELCIAKLLLGVLYTPNTRHVQYYSPFYVKTKLQLKRVGDVLEYLKPQGLDLYTN